MDKVVVAESVDEVVVAVSVDEVVVSVSLDKVVVAALLFDDGVTVFSPGIIVALDVEIINLNEDVGFKVLSLDDKDAGIVLFVEAFMPVLMFFATL